MDFIDSSCFCSILGEPFHWTWRTPGGGKMGVHWDTFTMAAFHKKQWVLALTSPVRSIQGLPSLKITGVNLHKVFSGKDSPFSCISSQPWKCKLVVTAWPVLPMGKTEDAEFRAALVPSCCGAHLDRVYSHCTCAGGHPLHCSHGQQLSAWLLELCTMTPFKGGFSHSVEVVKDSCSPGDSCLLWFGLCCPDVYPAWPTFWHMSMSTDRQ